MGMVTSNKTHVYYGIGLVPIDFYLLNRNDSKKLIEYCLKEGYIIKDFVQVCDNCIDIEEISQIVPFLMSNKDVFVNLNKRAPIVNMLGKGLMAVIEMLKIGEE
jgi:hypothetical protein